jgi:2-polyprenyl-3-methyl-5-hydroxy-6-metoxy-1,4-benzoquinol methylase
MTQTLEVVRKHFDAEAERFDAIYEASKPLHHRLMDRFRQVVVERFNLICNLAPLPGSWSVLDVGCGSGRYAFAMAEAGADRVVGVDVSENMIELARTEAAQNDLGSRCQFIRSAFLDMPTEGKFDVVIATGYFDYLEDPAAHLRKMVEMCQGRIFASFPKRWEFRVPIRKLRFVYRRAFVRFYSLSEVQDVFRAVGLPSDRVSLIDLGRDWIAVARVD